jgi:hypothetical protein
LLLLLLGSEFTLHHAHGSSLLIGVHAPGPLGLVQELLAVVHCLPPVLLEHVAPIQLPIADVVELRPVVLGGHGFFVPDDGLVNLALHKVVPALEELEEGSVGVLVEVLIENRLATVEVALRAADVVVQDKVEPEQDKTRNEVA